MTEGAEERRDPAAVMRAELASLLNKKAQTVDEFFSPIYIGSLLSSIQEEKVVYNSVLKNINAKLDRLELLEKRLAQLEAKPAPAPAPTVRPAPPLLSETDQAITDFIKSQGKVNAEDVQKQFNYKGKNAASARLSAMAKLGLLEKQQAGRQVYYTLKQG